MSEYCQKRGISEKYIIPDSVSFDSESNLRSIIDVLTVNALGKVAVVSSFFHLLRIKHTLDILKDRVSFIPYQFETSSPKISRYDFWKSIHYRKNNKIRYKKDSGRIFWVSELHQCSRGPDRFDHRQLVSRYRKPRALCKDNDQRHHLFRSAY